MISADVELSHCSPQIDNSGASNLETAVRQAAPSSCKSGYYRRWRPWQLGGLARPSRGEGLSGAATAQFLGLAAKWNLVERLSAHVAARRAECLFNTEEISILREQLVSFLAAAGCPCSTTVREFQPFLLDAWRSLGKLTGDIDASLPSILEVGVPTGVVSPIEPSGVSLDLILQDVAKGHAFELQGGEQEARERWRHLVAAGKLGVSQPPGKKLASSEMDPYPDLTPALASGKKSACPRWSASDAF